MRDRRAWLAAGAALLARLLLWGHLQKDPNALLRADSPSYLIPAANLVERHGFSRELAPPFTPEAFRTPGYPVFLAAHKLVVSGDKWPALTQCVLDAGTALLAAAAAAELGAGPWAWVAALLYGLEPMAAAHAPLILSESFFTFLCALALLLLLRAGPEALLPRALAAGFLLGLSAVTRPIATYLWIPLAAALAFSWRRRPASLAGFAFCAALLPALWCARNARLFSSFSMSTVPGLNMLIYDAAAVDAAVTGRPVEDASNELQERFKAEHGGEANPFVVSKLAGETARGIVLRHPFALARVHLVTGVKMLLGPGSELLAQELYDDQGAGVPDHAHAVTGRGTLGVLKRHPALWAFALLEMLILGATYLLCLRGAVVVWREGPFYRAAWLLPLAYLAIISTGGWCYYRFRVPIWPLFAALAAAGLAPRRSTVFEHG